MDRVSAWVWQWDQRGRLDLAVLAAPNKVGLALAAADFVLLEAVERDVIGVCLAAGGTLHLERVEKGRVFGVMGAEVRHSVQCQNRLSMAGLSPLKRDVPVELCFECEGEHHDDVRVV